MAAWTLAPVTTLPADLGSDEALARLAAAEHEYAVLMDGDAIAGLVDADALRSGKRPGLVVIDAADVGPMPWLARALVRSKAVAVLVLGTDGAPVGALPRAAVAVAAPTSIAGGTRMYGRPEVAPATYVCHQCAPPTYRRPTQAPAAPGCPRDFRHGDMERDD